MTTNRRQFINHSIAISGCAFLPEFLRNTSLYAAQQSQENILVVLQLSGGNDGLNTLIPYEEEKYYDQRPTLAVDKQRVIKLEQSLGLHPPHLGAILSRRRDRTAIIKAAFLIIVAVLQ